MNQRPAFYPPVAASAGLRPKTIILKSINNWPARPRIRAAL